MLIITFGIAPFPVLPAGGGNVICKLIQEVIINCYINLISAWKNIITVFILISLLSRLRTAEKDLDEGTQGSYSPGEFRSNGAVLGMLKVKDPKSQNRQYWKMCPEAKVPES